MTGLLYKELRQHWLLLLIAVLLPPVLILLLPFLSVLSRAHSVQNAISSLNSADVLIIRIVLLMIGYTLLSVLSAIPFMSDETKKWAYFTASHPKGCRGHVFIKYLFLFMLFGLFLVSAFCSDQIQRIIFRSVTGEALISLRNIIVMVFFLQLVLKGFNIPFTLRFGTKNSGNMVAVFLGLIVLGILILILFGPAASYQAMIDGAVNMLEQFSNNEISSRISVIFAAFPPAAVAVYLASCLLSCKVYLKGAANYTK